MTSRASATRSERRSRAELRRADNEQLLEWWIADRADNVRAELAERYQQMAQNLAARFANRGESRDDLAQVASFGILKALDRYSPDRGGSFESYAVPTAVGEIKRHFRDHVGLQGVAWRQGSDAPGAPGGGGVDRPPGS